MEDHVRHLASVSARQVSFWLRMLLGLSYCLETPSTLMQRLR